MFQTFYKRYGKDVKEYTNCPCCFKTYEDPWYLECGHTMNMKCVRRQQPIVKCPMCEDSFLISSSRLCKNRFANDLAMQVTRIDIIQLLLDNRKCSLHEEKNAESYCEKCHMKMCLGCSHFHDRNPKTKRHTVYEVNQMIEEKQDDIDINPVSMCEYHDNEIINNWCLDCKVPACEENCAQHHLEPISSYATDSNTQIQKLETHVEHQLSTARLSFQKVKKIKKDMKTEGKYHGSVAARLDWAKEKCKQIIKRSTFLVLEVNLLLKKGNEFHKCYSLPFLSRQIQRIKESTKSIESNSQHTSNRSSASTNSDYSLSGSSYAQVNPRLSRSTNALSDRATYINVNWKSSMEALYVNEQTYEDISHIESIIRVSSQSLSRSTKLSDDIQERLNFFDTGARITGMVYVNDTIVVASHSAGFCTGYDLHGKIQWDITERLNGPFDVAAHKTDDGKQFL
ncbi:tripartite motif-containing protein 5-like isoform X2 [Ostrea edulis]|uniref:tripartite motif-containing protein 5-like isoform X2 n=1 Tax=Ostrea edulis TaxID=37623 RepID=UPI0024AFA1E3|nr:tripartite motif-containing protein 5-like isoform X2 [Ostrea edulis]